ncbi:hypothetical protein ACFW9D_05865 [Streptomyces sp. NPDC059524]|uniref:hypothetical protein n=1 Tax=Streptomyces sp. NPDC059524 TaxID=3346856 RepID=UPI0036843878
MTDIHTADDDRRILRDAPSNGDDWDDNTWAAWFRTAERAHGERFDGDTKPANPRALLGALLHSARWALTLTKQGQTDEANEHVDAIERLIGAYRDAVNVEQPGVVGNELVVQWLDKAEGQDWWRDWGGSIPGLFLDEGKRLVKRARAAMPDKKVRLARRITLFRVEEIAEEQPA